MDERLTSLAELAVHGANVQPGQIVAVSATIGQEELARAVAAAAYKRGARFVDVAYFDPFVKRARIAARRSGRRSSSFRRGSARGCSRSPSGRVRASRSPASSSPTSLAGLDPALLGRDQLPGSRRSGRVDRRALDELDDRSLPASGLGEARLPRARPGRRLRAALGASSGTSCGSTSPTRPPPGTSGWRCSSASARRAQRSGGSTRSSSAGPGTELTVGLFRVGPVGRRRLRDAQAASATCRTCRPRRSSRPRTRCGPTAT